MSSILAKCVSSQGIGRSLILPAWRAGTEIATALLYLLSPNINTSQISGILGFREFPPDLGHHEHVGVFKQCEIVVFPTDTSCRLFVEQMSLFGPDVSLLFGRTQKVLTSLHSVAPLQLPSAVG